MQHISKAAGQTEHKRLVLCGENGALSHEQTCFNKIKTGSRRNEMDIASYAACRQR